MTQNISSHVVRLALFILIVKTTKVLQFISKNVSKSTLIIYLEF